MKIYSPLDGQNRGVWENIRLKRRTGTVASSATPAINTDATDYFSITALAVNITSMTSSLTGTPDEGDELRISILDDGTARTIAWGASFGAGIVALPTTTVISTRLDVLLKRVGSLWVCFWSSNPNINGKVSLANLLDLSAAGAGQIKFPATQNASADANTLDDYEEGTWTPAISFGSGNTGITYSVQNGTYVKIGKKVFFRAYIALSSKGSSTGLARVEGLPFSSSATVSSFSPLIFWIFDVSYTGMVISYVSVGDTYVVLSNCTEAGSNSLLDDTNFLNTSAIMVSGHYDI